MKIFVGLGLFAAIFFVLLIWSRGATGAVDPKDTQLKSLVIPKGASAENISNRLREGGLIKSKAAFRIYLKIKGLEKKIPAGDYRLSSSFDLQKTVSALITGPKGLWVTYPEGLRREEMALITIKSLEVEDKAVFWEEFITESEGLEGFLFPDTYLFERGTGAKKIVDVLKGNFDKKTEDLKDEFGKSGSTPLTTSSLGLEEVVNLASIVERETRTGEERPIVAGILLKRLERGMSLDVDATLQYIAGSKRCEGKAVPILDCDWWEVPLLGDRELRSPYNTYRNRGLPPYPIANPGLSSIKAVLNPEESPYFYYLHDREGKIHYGKTLEEQSENVARYIN